MPHEVFGLTELCRLLRESAGVSPDVDLDGNIADTDFLELGYDSIAIMEVVARVSREYGRTVDDEVLAEATTPRLLLDLVNGQPPARPASAKELAR